MNLIIPQIAPWLAVVTLTCVCVWGGGLFSSVQVESLVAPFTCKKKGQGHSGNADFPERPESRLLAQREEDEETEFPGLC